MQPSDLIVVGASAGGVEALRDFVAGLPEDLEAAVLIVLHLPPRGVSVLASILDRSGPLRAEAASDGTPLRSGTIYTAIPDYHLLVSGGRIVLSHGPTENGRRPGVDALFRSAALDRGPRVAGVVLSGALDDGTAGLIAVKGRGGLAAVQDPAEAMHGGMPGSALSHVAVDLVLPAKEIGAALADLMRARGSEVIAPPPSALVQLEARMDIGALVESGGVETVAGPSGFTCPDCHGELFALEPNRRYRCRVGHAWSSEALLLEQSLATERSLWSALRALEEKQQLADRMCADALRRGDTLTAERYSERRAEHADAAGVLRALLVGGRTDDSTR